MSVSTAVVLAAGEGTRLRPLTRNRPKPEHVFDALVDAGMERLVCVVGYKHDRVQDHFGPTYRSVPVQYVRQHKQLGSGHALLQARSAVDGPPLVVNGDRLIQTSMIEAVADAYERNDPAAALAVLEHPEARRYGAISLQNEEISELIEKPTSDEFRLINAGIYAFGTDIFDEIADTSRTEGELGLTDTIARLMDRDRVRGVRCEGMWVDATYPWDLLKMAREVLARGRIDAAAESDGVWVHEDALVHDDATLRAPVVVGPDSEIGPGAVVGPDVSLGRNVTVGAGRGHARRRRVYPVRYGRRPGRPRGGRDGRPRWRRGRPRRQPGLRGPATRSGAGRPGDRRRQRQHRPRDARRPVGSSPDGRTRPRADRRERGGD